ncbi:MAG TPA: ATP synthase F1 subunit gamma [Planctomycetaceae bacterium]|jgi:F-type H+-transporting ATPase subunit gamma|nr:ATP synthase F1 subunit gamma [Planctomycetaceae bacterium]
MAKARAIVKRLKAVKNIRKITRTMELIATGRFKRAMDRASHAAAYTRKISEIVADLSQANLQISHPLLEPRPEPRSTTLLALTSNRGLCGGYNAGVLRLVIARIRETRQTQEALTLEVSGKRGINFLKFQGRPADRTYTHFEDKPTFAQVEELADRFIEAFTSKNIDRLQIAYTKFESASRQVATLETLLPIGSLQTQAHVGATDKQPIEYEFLPSSAEILEEIVPAAFKARLFKCFLDAAVSEQIFRRVAMKAATENADDMIGSLSQLYNRARQTQITSELSEIIGGAAALE